MKVTINKAYSRNGTKFYSIKLISDAGSVIDEHVQPKFHANQTLHGLMDAHPGISIVGRF